MARRANNAAGYGLLGRARRSLVNRDFKRLWSGAVLFQIAWWMQITGLGWLILDLTDSPFKVALIGVFGWGPMLGLGLFGGMLADAFSRTAVIRATHTASALGSAGLASLLLMGEAEVWHAYGAMLVAGAGRALDQSARRALIHDLLGDRRVTNALALDSAAHHGSKAIGPALAGGLIALSGISVAYLACAAAFCAAALLMWTVRGTRPAGFDWSFRRVFGEIGAGVRYAVSNSTITGVILVTLVVNMFLFTYVNMIPSIARDALGVGPGLMGALSAADGVGAIIGTSAVAAAPAITHHGRIFVFGSLAGMVCLCLLSFSGFYPLSVALIFAIGLGTAGFSAMQGTVVMLVARPEMRGRCLGVITLVIGAGPLGAVLLGVVADWLGPLAAIRVNGIAGAALVAAVALWWSSLRRPIERDAAPV